MRYKIVRFQKLVWRNMIKSTKSQKASVLHYSIDWQHWNSSLGWNNAKVNISKWVPNRPRNNWIGNIFLCCNWLPVATKSWWDLGNYKFTTTISLSFLLTLKILLYENPVISLMLGTKKLLNLIKNQTKGFFEKLKKKKMRWIKDLKFSRHIVTQLYKKVTWLTLEG